MPDSEQPSEINQLRAFEMRMQTKGAAGFANGPEPWSHWREPDSTDDKRVWGCDREREETPTGRTQCEKLLTGMATVAVATLAVGIGGVYLSSSQSVPQVALDTSQPASNVATADQATTPSTAGRVIRATGENAPSANTGAMQQEIGTAIAASGAADNIIGTLAPPGTPLAATGTTPSIQAPAVIASADRLPQNPGSQAPADITADLPAPAAGTPTEESVPAPTTAAIDTPAKVSMVTPPVSSKAATDGAAEETAGIQGQGCQRRGLSGHHQRQTHVPYSCHRLWEPQGGKDLAFAAAGPARRGQRLGVEAVETCRSGPRA